MMAGRLHMHSLQDAVDDACECVLARHPPGLLSLVSHDSAMHVRGRSRLFDRPGRSEWAAAAVVRN